MSNSPSQRGAAILTAMITMTLVATVAAAAIAQQSRLVEVETAERSRVQAQWLLRGAMDWSRLLLRQDAQSSGQVDHLAEPWAVPLQETRLSSFLSAQDVVADTDASSGMSDAYMSGYMTDMQSRLNLMQFFVERNGIDPAQVALPVQRLFERLGLPQSEFELLAQGLRQVLSQTDAHDRPLTPQSLQDLVWLGVSPTTIRALEPYAALSNNNWMVNLNTASAPVIWSMVPAMDWSQAQALVAARASKNFRSVQQAQEVVPQAPFPAGAFAVNSQRFAATGHVRINSIALQVEAEMTRSNAVVTTAHVRSVGMALPQGIRP
ncbi:MAG: type II secretion system minor pseudopilin GspK [Comamonas sp.]